MKCNKNIFDFTSFDEKYDFLDKKFQSTFEYILLKLNRVGLYIISCSIVDSVLIQELNRNYRNIDKVTDVLSFNFLDKDELEDKCELYNLGEIYINIERCSLQASSFNNSTLKEVFYMFIHGVLHLFGYDHVNSKEEERQMFNLQDEIFSDINYMFLDKLDKEVVL